MPDSMDYGKFFPSRIWLVFILLLSLLGPVRYIIPIVFSPPDSVFMGFDVDDSVFLSLIKSSSFDYKNPWLGGEPSVFHNPALGTAYLFAPVGALGFLVGISPFSTFMLFKFLSAFFFLMVVYNFIRIFTSSKNERHIAFLFLVLVGGLGGLLLLFIMVFTNPSAIIDAYPLIGIGVGVFRMFGDYRLFPLAALLLSVMFVMRRKFILCGMLAGITLLVYPMFGFAALLLIVVHEIFNFEKFNVSLVKKFLKIIIPFLAFGIPWVVTYFQARPFFSNFSSFAFSIDTVFIPSLILDIAFSLLFCFYGFFVNKKQPKRLFFIVTWALAVLLVSLSRLSGSFWSTHNSSVSGLISGLGLLPVIDFVSKFSILLEIPFFILLAKLFFDIYKSRKNEDKNYRLALVLLFVTSFLVVLPNSLIFWLPGRFKTLMLIFLSIFAARGLIKFSSIKSINYRLLFMLIVILSLPSVVLYNVSVQADQGVWKYYSKSEYDALLFLKSQPQGVVLSSGEIGTYLPYVTNKMAVLVGKGSERSDLLPDIEDRLKDFEDFYYERNVTGIAEKYNITYVFYGGIESGINKDFSPDGFELIYDISGIKIFREG